MLPATELLEILAAKFELNAVSPEATVEEAVQLLTHLPENVALAELAGSEPAAEAVRQLIAAALEEEGLKVPDGPTAGRLVAGQICAGIAQGTIEPIQGARDIWWRVVDQVPELEEEFIHFVGYASEWEDDAAHREDYTADIRAAALEVCAR